MTSKTPFFFLFVLSLVLSASARHLDVTPVGGYFFKEKFPVVNGTVSLKEGAFYGGILSHQLSDELDAELQVMTRSVPVSILRNDTLSTLELRNTWISLNGCYNFDLDAPAMPFLELGMGWVHLDPEGEKRDSENRFAMNVGLGLKVAFSDRFGLRLSTNLLASFNSSSAFEDENGQEAYLVNKMSYVTELGFRGGVYFRIID